MYHRPCHAIYYQPVATWRLAIHDNAFCFCHKLWLPRLYRNLRPETVLPVYPRRPSIELPVFASFYIQHRPARYDTSDRKRLRAGLDNRYYAVRAVDNDTECLSLSAAKPKGSPGTSFQVMA